MSKQLLLWGYSSCRGSQLETGTSLLEAGVSLPEARVPAAGGVEGGVGVQLLEGARVTLAATEGGSRDTCDGGCAAFDSILRTWSISGIANSTLS